MALCLGMGRAAVGPAALLGLRSLSTGKKSPVKDGKEGWEGKEEEGEHRALHGY